jgi:hypothetical protein
VFGRGAQVLGPVSRPAWPEGESPEAEAGPAVASGALAAHEYPVCAEPHAFDVFGAQMSAVSMQVTANPASRNLSTMSIP